ncbi:ferritin-like domain-containing protein [Kordiimonas aquimaris]|uniref:ferritin-like domain-containing protein n=1 Tax=Kordiimonas aquimaris TaxID=707591 RepID=UPI0021CEBAC8|nr:ferritin-like domain-containing protein [Kordiimonas aquimaris]
MNTWATIGDAACAVLTTGSALEKSQIARKAVAAWKAGELSFTFPQKPPTRPARPEKPELLPPNEMPRRRKAGNASNRRALLHAIAHIELNAIDLAFDLVVRFGADMPRNFTDDWLSVGDDEARHFSMLSNRLTSIDSFYGDLPAHDGLWQSAIDTADNIAARLAVVPMVLEARGLDVTPSMIKQFERVGDQTSADVLQVIYNEEVGHVATGCKWFNYVASLQEKEPETWFKELIASYFHGQLKPPFNVPARSKAGMPESYYSP